MRRGGVDLLPFGVLSATLGGLVLPDDGGVVEAWQARQDGMLQCLAANILHRVGTGEAQERHGVNGRVRPSAAQVGPPMDRKRRGGRVLAMGFLDRFRKVDRPREQAPSGVRLNQPRFAVLDIERQFWPTPQMDRGSRDCRGDDRPMGARRGAVVDPRQP